VFACRKKGICESQWQEDFTKIAWPWLKHAINEWGTISVKHKEDHLDQALLYKDNDMEVLIHRFDECGVQSYVHNHKSSFASMCLGGSYVESRWHVNSKAAGSYIEYQR